MRIVIVCCLFAWFVLCTLADDNDRDIEQQSEDECLKPSFDKPDDVNNNNKEEKEEDCGCSKGTNRAQGSSSLNTHDNNNKISNLLMQITELLQNSGKIDSYREYKNPLVLIPGGQFIMGTDKPEILLDGEGPARSVMVSTFSIQEKEVSNLEFARFVLETGYVTDAEKFGWSFVFEQMISENIKKDIKQAVAQTPWWLPVNGSNWFHPEGPDRDVVDRLMYPVVHVSHMDARAFCEHYDMRLPREAEFEYVLKGGKDDGREFAWGNDLYGKYENGSVRYYANLFQGTFPFNNTADDGYIYSCPVDAFGIQNEMGLYNIAGNVWEWVADAWSVNHSRLKDKKLENPQMELSMDRLNDPTVERVKRGGSYMCHKSYCFRYRTVSRSQNSADSSASNLGFRCAKDHV